jgi:hypothetical protein
VTKRKLGKDHLANSVGYKEGDEAWLFQPTHMKGKSPKLKSSWESPYRAVNQKNNVVYRI